MKKLLIVMGFCAMLLFASRSARADEYFDVNGTVNSIEVWHSSPLTDVPVASCDLNVTVTTANNQTYTIPAEAFGTQINLALWDARVNNRTISMRLRVRLYPFYAEIVAVDHP